MNKAVFLDRDGVINYEDGDYTYDKEFFRINDDVFEALKIFIDRGYLLIVITNQSGIAKSVYHHENVEELHEYMSATFAEHGIEFTEIYYCPHHPDFTECLCRKPQNIMVEKALARFNIDPKASFVIGDRERDIIAGGTAGLTGILIESNSSLVEVVPMIP
ncbi:MAG: HAD family hydrolase [Flavobacteriales bacterium]|nr:HAD family hydrolase [Flavobacteriales bacterium]